MSTGPEPSSRGPTGGGRSTKGVFSRLRLPVAQRYLFPARRRLLLLSGLVVGLAVLAAGLWDTFFGQAAFLSGGPLSSAHAMLEQDCASCHSGFRAVADDACSTCHESFGRGADELGIFSFGAHYVYRSGDFQRLRIEEDELACATCHPEHQGRQARVLDVPDARCQDCHERSHFDRDHPDFAFTADPEGDDDAIAFAHGPHVREVMEKGGWVDLERACLACHQPSADGRRFEPIDFDLHCDACHLNAGVATPRLAVAEGSAGSGEGSAAAAGLGVWNLDQIRSSGLPGTDWAFYMDPRELREAGRRVMKTTLHHEDPWVLFNLRRLRKLRYPDAGLADYLTTSPDLDAEGVRALYQEAVATLEEQAVGLRGSADPGVQEQLRKIEIRLEGVRRLLVDPAVPLDETELLLALSAPLELEAEAAETWDELVAGLTAPCATCHRIQDATFVRAAPDQRSMGRAEFDHGAHVIQRRCLDCHGELPILEALSAPADPGAAGGAEGATMGGAGESEHDRAAIYNLPRIASCRECHRSGAVASRCVDCHLFHPDTSRHADLLLYVEEAP